MRNFLTLPTLTLAALTLTLPIHAAETDTNGFITIFDGKTLNGWHPSPKTGHSRASKNESAGKWFVQDGAIHGHQDIPGNGGIILTDQQYGDFEVSLEMNNDFGLDSGLFLRSTEDGKAWQAMIDYHGSGNLMGIYGEGLDAKPSIRSYSFAGSPDKITVNTNSPVPLVVLPDSWKYFWRHGQWNELRARIVNNPPHITTWINGVKIMEWQETEIRHPATGSIALQVHGGGNHTNKIVRYRNIRVKQLSPQPK